MLDLTGDRLVNLILDGIHVQKSSPMHKGRRSLLGSITPAASSPAAARFSSAPTPSPNRLDNVINVQGDIRATAATAQGGVISLPAAPVPT